MWYNPTYKNPTCGIIQQPAYNQWYCVVKSYKNYINIGAVWYNPTASSSVIVSNSVAVSMTNTVSLFQTPLLLGFHAGYRK